MGDDRPADGRELRGARYAVTAHPGQHRYGPGCMARASILSAASPASEIQMLTWPPR
ncbi:MAG: hypothetical protein ABUL62_34415 [Myxococcales bacterium]